MLGQPTPEGRGMQNDHDDDLLREEEDAAATEAARIGGRSGMEDMDEAKRAAAEHGGGEAEGFEEAEELLEEQATHGNPSVDPLDAVFDEEAEEELATYGEADSIESTEAELDTEGIHAEDDGP
jgi:hypothetical protein